MADLQDELLGVERHILVVHQEPDDGMDVDHPDSCPVETIYDGRVKVRTCLVGETEMQFSLGDFFHRAGTQGEGEPVTVGRHPIEYWTNGATDDRFECGLRLATSQGGTR